MSAIRTCTLQISPTCLKQGMWRGKICRRCIYRKRYEYETNRNRAFDWKKYASENKERINKVNLIWQKKKHANDPKYRISKNLRHRIWLAIKTNPKHHRMNDIIGCSKEELMVHLESQWKDGMNWSNYGKGTGKWEIDHIVPCASYNMALSEDQAKCFHFSNLQPMWGTENIVKGCKLTR